MDWPIPHDESNPLEDGLIFEKEFQDVVHGNGEFEMEGFEMEDLPTFPGHDAVRIDPDSVVVDETEFDVPLQSPMTIDLTTDEKHSLEEANKELEYLFEEDSIVVHGEDLDDNLDGTITPEEDTLTLATPIHNLPKSSTVTVAFPESTLLTPRSRYEPFDAGAPIVSELEANARLVYAATQAGQDPHDFVEFQLDNFAIYRHHALFPEEMCSLHHLDTKMQHSGFFFDGLLSVGGMRFFVNRVPIATLPIGNYGTLKKHTVRDQIWVQSDLNSGKEIYYRLRTPAKEYRRFFDPFLWVADLGKHFVDFLKNMGDNKRNVGIFRFRTTFSTWMKKHHGGSPTFISWKEQHPSEDFRTSIIANINYLRKETIGVLGEAKAYTHAIWLEICDLKYYQRFENNVKDPPTVVTKYIHACFSHLPFGDRLEVVELSKETKALRTELTHKHNLELPSPIHETTKDISTAATQQIKDIQVGDTISTHRDGEDSGTRWRRDISHGFNDVDRWFALVQSVKTGKRGRRTFNVIWYYRAVDTLCGLMKYPWNNELFLSDHCSCGEATKIEEDEVLGVHDVEFGGTSATKSEFFCRQTYVLAERKWITLRTAHLRCSHVQPIQEAPEHAPGDTLLVVLDKKTARSEPCEFITCYEENGSEIYRFRRLLRRKQVDRNVTGAAPNELVYSQQLVEVRKHRIQEQCYVRFFHAGQAVPTPYDRDGVGGFFYITHEEIFTDHTVSYTPLMDFPITLKQAYDPGVGIPKLRGLDLFCGGGNFGRGLEDGGGIEMKWANDYDEKAIHTYMANLASSEAVSPFLGSIDDLQRLAIKGKFSKSVPAVGDVDFISGGSPCPGFSNLTNDKTTLVQRKNQSLVAAFGSFIDLYRPKYGLLENVTGIVQRKATRDQDVFSQLICAIVGLGYQTQFFFLDACSCGSPQRRSRVFLAFAAPGYQLPRRPMQTHAHPLFTKALTLGNLPNGESMAERYMPLYTPFDFVSGAEATSNLPPIYDAKPDICVPYPDHRISIGITKKLGTLIKLIPNRPWGINFAQAWYGPSKRHPGSGTITASEREFFPVDSGGRMSRVRPNSNAYGRQFPNRLIETVTTSQSPADTKNGRTLHWSENRVLTIMEARRAQGFRDDEVLLGGPVAQYRLVGNSVARQVAVALGVVFREAWVASLKGEKGVPVLEAAATAVEESTSGDSIFVEGSTSDSSLDTDTDSTFQHKSLSPTPATTISSPTPPPSGAKRPRSGSIVVEIPISKASKSRRGDSPSLGKGLVGNSVIRTSPLGRSVIVVDDD
ncbi:Fc.00g028240.m01.CDS01 [Cosmosporella sp. VM-42]